LENQYYGSKGLKEENPVAALQSFEKVLCKNLLLTNSPVVGTNLYPGIRARRNERRMGLQGFETDDKATF